MIVFIPIAADVDPDLPVVRMEAEEDEIMEEIIDDVIDIIDTLRNFSQAVLENMTSTEISEMKQELSPRLGNILNYYDEYEEPESIWEVEIAEGELIYQTIPSWAKFSSLALIFCITIMVSHEPLRKDHKTTFQIIIILRQRRLMLMKKLIDEQYQPFDNKSLLD